MLKIYEGFFMKKFVWIFLSFIIFHHFTHAELIHDYGNYPTFGFQINTLGGGGLNFDEIHGDGAGGLVDFVFNFNYKPLNKLYLLEAKDGPDVYVSNIIGLFLFGKITGTNVVYSKSNSSETYSKQDGDTTLGFGIHFELPFITEGSGFDDERNFYGNPKDTYARSYFIDSSVGYDANDGQIKLNIFPGINIGAGSMGKYIRFQMDVGFDMRFTFAEDVNDLLNSSYMLVLGCKFAHDFNHFKYLEVKQGYIDMIKKKEQDLNRKRYEKEQAEKRKKEEQQKVVNTYKEKYTVYQNYLFPQLYGKSANVEFLTGSNQNFIKNIPYGFRNDIYYVINEQYGDILQWINSESCLFNFKQTSYSAYGYVNNYTGLAYVYFDSTVTSYPFDKDGILYIYTGVYNYVTALGTSNIIPKFKAIYTVGKLPNQ